MPDSVTGAFTAGGKVGVTVPAVGAIVAAAADFDMAATAVFLTNCDTNGRGAGEARLLALTIPVAGTAVSEGVGVLGLDAGLTTAGTVGS